MTPAKPLDKLHVSYERKIRLMRKTEDDAGGNTKPLAGTTRRPTKAGGRYGSKTLGKIKSELKTSEQIRKSRKIMENKRAKNARSSRNGGKKKGRP